VHREVADEQARKVQAFQVLKMFDANVRKFFYSPPFSAEELFVIVNCNNIPKKILEIYEKNVFYSLYRVITTSFIMLQLGCFSLINLHVSSLKF
jgi:hypothetical protein